MASLYGCHCFCWASNKVDAVTTNKLSPNASLTSTRTLVNPPKHIPVFLFCMQAYAFHFNFLLSLFIVQLAPAQIFDLRLWRIGRGSRFN